MDNKTIMCIPHDKKWRGPFQHAKNILNSQLVHGEMPKACLFRFSKAVCVCSHAEGEDKSEIQTQSDSKIQTLDVANARQLIQELPSMQPEELTSELDQSIIIQKIKKIDLEESDLGILRFLYVLRSMLHGDFSLLTVEKKEKEHQEKPSVTDEKGVLLVGALQKKKFKLFLPKGYFGNFFGKKGELIKPILQKYDAAVTLNRFTTVEELNGGFTWVTPFKIKKRSQLYQLAADLNAHAKLTREKREKHHRQVEIYKRNMRSYFENRWAEKRSKRSRPKNQDEDLDNNVKEVNRRLHCLKTGNTIRHHKPLPVLTNSRCLNCLTEYKNTAENYKENCVFHKGFYDACSKEWSCCQVSNEDENTLESQHKSTGCMKGFHNWRPKKHSPGKRGGGPHSVRHSSRKMNSKMTFYEEDFM